MNNEEIELTEITPMVKAVMELKTAFIIVGGEKEEVYGTLNFKTMFAWTSKEKAEKFIELNLDFKEDKSIEYPIQELLGLARKLNFRDVRFDFEVIEDDSKKPFLHYRLAGMGILDLLSLFFSN